MSLILDHPYVAFALFLGVFAAIVVFRHLREEGRKRARAALAPRLGLAVLAASESGLAREAWGSPLEHLDYLLGSPEVLLFEHGPAVSRDAAYAPKTCAAFRCGGIGPRFVLEPLGGEVPGSVRVPGLPEAYRLVTEDPKACDRFGSALVKQLRERPGWCLAHRDNGWLLVHRAGGIPPERLASFLDEARVLKTLLLEKSHA